VAVAGSDLDGLEAAVEGFEAVGARLLAAEAAAQAYDVHRRRATGKQTAAAQRARRLYGICSGASRPVALAEEVRLTTREREVASLAVMGVSNRDIAERLVISVRTAESHLQHVYAKLGVTTRAELARVLGPERSGAGSV